MQPYSLYTKTPYPKVVIVSGQDVKATLSSLDQETLQIVEDLDILLQCIFEHLFYTSIGPREAGFADSLAADFATSLLEDPVGEPPTQDLFEKVYHALRNVVYACTQAVNSLGAPITQELPYEYSHRRHNNIVLRRTTD